MRLASSAALVMPVQSLGAFLELNSPLPIRQLHIIATKTEGPVARPLLKFALLRLRHLRPARRRGAAGAAAYPACCEAGRAARRRRRRGRRVGRLAGRCRRAGGRLQDRASGCGPAGHDRQDQAGGKEPAARNAVVRVSTLAVPRLDMNPPPPPPIPSPPPSDFCSSTTPIMAQHDHEMDDDKDSLHEACSN